MDSIDKLFDKLTTSGKLRLSDLGEASSAYILKRCCSPCSYYQAVWTVDNEIYFSKSFMSLEYCKTFLLRELPHITSENMTVIDFPPRLK